MRRLRQINIEIDGRQVPAKIYQEMRNNVRVSIGKSAAILRIPSYFDKKQTKSQIGWFTRWVQKQFDNNEYLRNRFFPTPYSTGDQLKVGDRIYHLTVDFEKRKTSTAKLVDRQIYLKVNNSLSPLDTNKSIKHLLSRVVAKDFHAQIASRVYELNARYFNKPIKNVTLKYNTSNWGSCSVKSNINLSTRLLFAPPDVIDYVIVHELAHLVEMNHSSKYWKIVKSIIPDYKQKQRWLKDHSAECDF